ncbi:hypothetical protein SDC9_49562 [bioreactor metagenome]|uniref:Secretion system C-terminal sorting domain-containing protein n=1 Tax=bioreactor metagenome TaxID=1076179 RepID=A0A644WIA6_9ZZZZ
MHSIVIIKRISYLPGIILLLWLILSGLHVSAQIAAAEYFWDTDPGNGLATPIYASDGNLDEAIETLLSSGVNQPAVGVHTFNIRVKDSGNFWGPVFTSVINIENTITSTDKKVIQAEYFWDTDPGNGNGTTILALDGNLNEAIETIFSSGVNQPAAGMHTFNVRVKDFGNFWGPVFTSVINVESAVTAIDKKVIQAEYFWDTDPGNGNGTTILALDGNFDEAIETIFSSGVNQPAVGIHTFNVRVKDFTNFWGPVFTSIINIENTITSTDKKVIQAEYFWDTDPGNGNGTTILALDGNLNEAIETIFSSGVNQPAAGMHTFNVRVKDFGNFWGPVFTSVIQIENAIIASENKVIQAEYFWDADPGNGNGTTILALDGNLDEAIETLLGNSVSTSGLNLGAHTFNIRVKDYNSYWGPVFSNVVEITDCIAPAVNLGVDRSICDGQSVTLDASNHFAAYAWSTGETTQTINLTAPGTYSVSAIDTLGCVRKDTIVIFSQQHVALGNDTTICPATSLILNAGIFASYAWSTSQSSASISISPAAANNYSVTVTDASGCQSADTVYVNLFPWPVVNLGNDTSLCVGETLMLDAGTFASYIWTGGSSSQYLTVSATGTYGVTVTDGNSCHNSDNIAVTVHSLPAPDLGPDQVICDGNPQILDAGVFSTYLWSDMSTGQTLPVSSPGNYSVTVTDGNGCHGSDAILVTASSTVNTSLAYSICQGNSYNFNGSILTTAGIYHDTLVSAAGCDSIVALTLTVNPLPVVDLGPDTTICITESIVLNAGIHDSYNWSTGATSQYLLIDSTGYGTGAHLFSVIVSDDFCQASDAIIITFDACAGLNNNESGSVSLYPNPGNGFVYVNLENIPAGNIAFMLYNPDGQLLQTWERDTEPGIPEEIDFSDLPSGVYFLKISGPEINGFYKLISNRL